jgi:uncharacterized protein (DUF924 family)
MESHFSQRTREIGHPAHRDWKEFCYLNFTHPIHLADNRQSSRRYFLTRAHEQTSDAPTQY